MVRISTIALLTVVCACSSANAQGKNPGGLIGEWQNRMNRSRKSEQAPRKLTLPQRSFQPVAWQQNQISQPTSVAASAAMPGVTFTNASPVAVSSTTGAPVMAAPSMGQYPHTAAPMYPSPQPNIPYYVGGSAYTNQAFYPHEMLYEHKYKAMYPPYYYRTKGSWVTTPFGVWSHEDWQVKGTEVEVEYRSHISPLSLFASPIPSPTEFLPAFLR